MGISLVDQIVTDEVRAKHDPTGSFNKTELAAIEVLMAMPVDVWADVAKSGKADEEKIAYYKAELDKVAPGYGELFLGDVTLSEDQQLARWQTGPDGYRPPVNYKRDKDGKIRPYYGDITHGELQPPDLPKIPGGYDPDKGVPSDLQALGLIPEPKTKEELAAWKEYQDKLYELQKSKLEYEELQRKSNHNT